MEQAATYILSIESATKCCSVAISQDGDVLAYERSVTDHSHSAKLTVLIERCFAQIPEARSKLNAIAISSGPGSYTGLRVGASVAKGLCMALDIPLISINTLKIIAQGQIDSLVKNSIIVAHIDARRDEVYSALYDAELNEIIPPTAVILDKTAYDTELERYDQVICVGDCAEKCHTLLDNNTYTYVNANPDAAHMVKLALETFAKGKFENVALFEPIYLKAPNITQSKKKLF